MLGGLCLASCCEKGDIAYDGNKWANFGPCYDSLKLTAVENIGQDPTKLISSIKLMFAGNSNACSAAMQRLPEATWYPIRQWIENGGRFWLSTEYGANKPGESGSPPIPPDEQEFDPGKPGCLRDPEKVNDFLAALGTGLSWYGGVDYSGAACDDNSASCTSGSAAIASGVGFKIGVTAKLEGGTTVWYSKKRSVPCVVVQSLGDGFVFVCGDSNVSDGCNYNNCAFFRKLYQAADGDIL